MKRIRSISGLAAIMIQRSNISAISHWITPLKAILTTLPIRSVRFFRYPGIKWYDGDFIGIMPGEAEDVALDEMLQEAAVDKDEISKVKAICSASGIEKANAMSAQ